MTKTTNGAAEGLLQKLRVAKVKWADDGQLLIGLVSGPHSWSQLRQICDDKFAELAGRIRRVAMDTGGGVLDCWWDVQAVCTAGFAPPEAGWGEEWEFVFQVKIPPGKQEQSWMAPRRVAFVINGRQLIVSGREP